MVIVSVMHVIMVNLKRENIVDWIYSVYLDKSGLIIALNHMHVFLPVN